MKTPGIYYVIFALFCLAALSVGTAATAGGMHTLHSPKGWGDPGTGLTGGTVQNQASGEPEYRGRDALEPAAAVRNGALQRR